jgi:hypothetical protein
MTSKTDFTDEEWARLVRSPLVAGMAISLADPGGPIETLKETMATAKPILEIAQKGGGENELIDAVAKDIAAKAQQRQNPMKDFRPKGTMAGEEILEELRGVNALVTEKATPEEAQAFREWLVAASQRAADAAKEGGFLGFRAEQVSEGERRMLERVREALSA